MSTVDGILATLREHRDQSVLEDMGPRYGIHTDQALGVAMRHMKQVAKPLGTDHELALALWDSGWYEARVVACLVDDPAQVTAEQMDTWCEDFDNWATPSSPMRCPWSSVRRPTIATWSTRR